MLRLNVICNKDFVVYNVCVAGFYSGPKSEKM